MSKNKSVVSHVPLPEGEFFYEIHLQGGRDGEVLGQVLATFDDGTMGRVWRSNIRPLYYRQVMVPLNEPVSSNAIEL